MPLYKGTELITGVKVSGITGIDTSDANAIAGDILSGKTAYVNDNKVTGTIQSLAAQTIDPTDGQVVLPAGKYLSGDQTILAASGNLVNSVTVIGNYTSSTYQQGSYVACNPDTGILIITTKGGSSSSYGNVRYEEHSFPLGVSILDKSRYDDAGRYTNDYSSVVISGINQLCNVSLYFVSVNTQYDYVECKISIQYV